MIQVQEEIQRRFTEGERRRQEREETGIDLEKSLRDYITQAWHMVEPATVFIPNWHIDAIADHLQAVTLRHIRNLLITMPPRCIKSLAASVFWPTWVWISNPAERWLYSSYAMSLSTRDSLKCRRIIESPWYQRRWGDRYHLTSDQNAKTRFENNKTGYRLATSVGGANTGEGAGILVIDDPHNVLEAESDTIRSETLIWWDEVMSTRLNDPKTGAKVIIQQRTHESDLAGHVLEQGGYVHLNLPMEFEPARKCIVEVSGPEIERFHWEDPRTEEDELLWPDRFGRAEVDSLKISLGSYGTAGQLQQRPTPRGGGMLKRFWFPIVDVAPVEGRRLRWWDLAATEDAPGKDPDWTAGVKILKSDSGVFYVEDIQHFRESPFNVEMLVKQTAQTDGRAVPVWMEQEPGSAGKNTIAAYARLLAGFDFHGERSTGAKETFVAPFAAQAEAGNIRLIKADWNEPFLKEIESFPNGRHDDMIDAASKGFIKLCNSFIPVISPGMITGQSKWKIT